MQPSCYGNDSRLLVRALSTTPTTKSMHGITASRSLNQQWPAAPVFTVIPEESASCPAFNVCGSAMTLESLPVGGVPYQEFDDPDS